MHNSFRSSLDSQSRAPDVQVSPPLASLCLAQLQASYTVLLRTRNLTTSCPQTRVLHQQGLKPCLINLVTFFFLKGQNTILVTVLLGEKVLFILMIHFGGFWMMLY